MKSELIGFITMIQVEMIRKNLCDFEENFEPLEIEYDNVYGRYHVSQGIYAMNVFKNMDELNGWLLGCIQTINRKIK